jgi:hypothetical protein
MRRKKTILVLLATLFVFSIFSFTVCAYTYQDSVSKTDSKKIGNSLLFSYYDYGTWLPGDDAYIEAHAAYSGTFNIATINYNYNGMNYQKITSSSTQSAIASYCSSGYDYMTGYANASCGSQSSYLTVTD